MTDASGQFDWPGPPFRGRGRGLIRVALEGTGNDAAIVWSFTRAQDSAHARLADDRGVLGEFTELANATPRPVLSFARRRGVLATCAHHIPKGGPHSSAAPSCAHPTQREPVWVWQSFAREAAALRTLAAALRDGGGGRDEDWRALLLARWERSRLPDDCLKNPIPLPPAAGRRGCIRDYVHAWISMTNLRPLFRWGAVSSVPQVMLAGTGVLASVTRGLLQELAGARGQVLELCAECGHPFTPHGRPGPPALTPLCDKHNDAPTVAKWRQRRHREKQQHRRS